MSTTPPEYPSQPEEPTEGSAGSYPIHPGTPEQPAGPAVAPPASIVQAVRLMWVGAGLTILGLVYSLFTLGDLRDDARAEALKNDSTLSASDLDAVSAVVVVVAVVAPIIGAALWLWMAWKNGQGRKWARVVGTVLGGLNVLTFLGSLAAGGLSGLSVAIGLVNLVLAVVILYFLYRKESSEYYAYQSRPKFA